MDDILASIRKIIADDFSISGGTKSYNSEERLGGDPGDDGENSDSEVLDLGKPSPLVHSLSGASSRQVESDSAPLTGLRRDVSEVPSLRRPNVTQLRSASEEENTEYAQRPVLSQVTDRHVRSVSERLSTLHPSSKLESQDPLIGRTVEASVSSAFKNLQDVSRKAAVESRQVSTSPTLESVVIEALKPLLREWLDTNLPGIVEELVKVEIERLTERR